MHSVKQESQKDNKMIRRSNITTFFIFSVILSLLIVNIYGLSITHPVSKEKRTTQEVLYDSNSFIVYIHFSNNSVFITVLVFIRIIFTMQM